MKTTFFFLTWLILLGIIKRLFPDWFKNTKPEEDRKVIKPENPPIKVPKEEKVLTKPTTTQSSSIPLNPQGYDYDNTPIKKQKKAKKEKHKREFFTENMPDDFYSLNKLILTPVFSVANLKKPEDFVLEFSVKGLNVYGKEIPTGEIIWETSGGKVDKNGRLMIDSNAQGFYEVTATAKDSIKHTKFVRNTLLTVGVSTRILKWSIANESFFYDILSQLFEFSFDFDGDGEISIDELMIGDWMIDFGRKYILKFLTKTSNFFINEYLKTISVTTFYLVIPAPSQESSKSISSTSTTSSFPPDPSKGITPEKDPNSPNSENINIIELVDFLSKYKAIEGTAIRLQFTKNFIEVGVQTSDFFISEKYPFNGDINGLVEVKAPEFLEVLSELKTKEITFELKEGLLYLTPDISISVERVVEAKPQKTKNIVVIPDTALLREYAKISLVSRTKTEMPEKPYVDGLLWGGGLILLAANPAMAASHAWPLKQLKDWGASVAVSDETNVRIFLPSKAILELPEKEPLELHIGARSILMKAGTMTVKIDRFKDPLNAYIKSVFHEKAGDFRVTFMDAPSTQPSREKLINWLDQSKAKACDMSMGPDGIWVGPRGSLKDPKTIDKQQCLQLGDIPFAGTYRVVTFSSLVIEALRHSKSEITKISFPQKKGEVLYISTEDENHGYDDVYGVVSYTEIPIAEVAEIPALIDETPIAVEQGTETLVEVPTTTGEAIKQAIIENKVPEEIQETVEKALKQMEAVNTIVPSKPAELAEAQKAIIETAIVEAIDPENVLNLDPQTKKKAKAVKEAVEDTKAKLETEIQSESIDLNRIIALTIKLETLGGRFIEITFALQTKWYPTLTITEEVKAEARKQYPHLAQ